MPNMQTKQCPFNFGNGINGIIVEKPQPIEERFIPIEECFIYEENIDEKDYLLDDRTLNLIKMTDFEKNAYKKLVGLGVEALARAIILKRIRCIEYNCEKSGVHSEARN